MAFDLLGSTHVIARHEGGKWLAACGWSVAASPDDGDQRPQWVAAPGVAPSCLRCRRFLYTPPPTVLEAFDAHGRVERIDSGQGQTVRVGDVVLKYVDNAAEIEFCSQIVDRLPADALQLAPHRRARSGHISVGNWVAYERVEGQVVSGRWAEKLAIARAFHDALAGIDLRPTWRESATDRWTLADRQAWSDNPNPADCQLVHCDIAGNILFDDSGRATVIDWSLYWRPVAYAEAILIVDATAWLGASTVDFATMIDPAAMYRAELFRAACS